MIDVETETLIPIPEVPALKWLPRRRRVGQERQYTPQAVYKWTKGLKRFPNVKLETVQCGGVLCTSEAALKRFFERLRAPSDPGRTDSQKAKARQRAAAVLDAAGI